jgi:hypothetical protein
MMSKSVRTLSILSLAVGLYSSPASALDHFKSLYECYSGFSRKPIWADKSKKTLDFQFSHVQRFSDKSTSSGLVTVGKDAFLILTPKGAEILNPVAKEGSGFPENSPSKSRHSYKVYNLRFSLPGSPDSKDELTYDYWVDKQDPKEDQGNWVHVYSPAQQPELQKSPSRPTNFDEAVTLLRLPVQKMADRFSKESKAIRTSADLQVFDADDIARKTAEINGRLEALKACSQLGDATIQAAADQEKGTLKKLEAVTERARSSNRSGKRESEHSNPSADGAL